MYRTRSFIIHILFQDQKEQVTEVKKEEKISFNPVDQVIDDIKLIGENVEQEVAEDVEQEVAEVQKEDVGQEVAEVQDEDVEQEVAEVQEADVEQEVAEVQEADVEQEEEQEQEVEDMAENVEIGRCRRSEGAENYLLVSFR